MTDGKDKSLMTDEEAGEFTRHLIGIAALLKGLPLTVTLAFAKDAGDKEGSDEDDRVSGQA
jgi:hypothetical protein